MARMGEQLACRNRCSVGKGELATALTGNKDSTTDVATDERWRGISLACPSVAALLPRSPCAQPTYLVSACVGVRAAAEEELGHHIVAVAGSHVEQPPTCVNDKRQQQNQADVREMESQ